MLKIIIVAMLLLLSLMTSAQTENRTAYVLDIGHNRDCRGGLGTCPKSVLTTSKEKTTASVAKTGQNKLQLSLDKRGFSSKEWDELLSTKTFPLDDDSIKVDVELLRLLAIDPKFNGINKGLYPVTFIEDKATIVFELVERK